MASSSSSSRSHIGLVSLSEVRNEQRRVAALLQASGQVNVTFPPRESISFEDLYKSKFYRRIQAAHLHHHSEDSRVPPLGHPLVNNNPLVTKKYGGSSATEDLDHHGNLSRLAALARSVQAEKRSLENRRQVVCLKKSLTKSHASESSIKCDTPRQKIEFSKYGSLPDIIKSKGIEEKPTNDEESRSSVEYRHPKWRKDQSTDRPHLLYNHGVAPHSHSKLKVLPDISSLSGWSSEDSDLDPELSKDGTFRHRKRKHGDGPSTSSYENNNVPANSPASSSSSSASGSRSHFTTNSASPQPDNPHRTTGKQMNEQINDEVNQEFGDASKISEANTARPGDDQEPGVGSLSQVKTHRDPSGPNPDGDPYGQAYVQALSVARSKAMMKDPFYLSQRLTRPFTFSYFCEKDVCTCGKCPKKKKKRKRGRTGFKEIFGDVNMYDYFKWPNNHGNDQKR